jgi:hypothetical protein
MSKEKETKMNLKTVLTKAKYENLIKGSQTWKTFDKNAEASRAKFYVIGKGLDVIYSDLKDKGIKRDEIARLFEQYFPDMTVQNRSDFRKMALNHTEVETFCLEHYAKGFSPSNILYNWTRFKAKLEKANETETEIKTGSNDNTTGKRTKVTDEGLEVQPHKLKTGIEIADSKVTVKDMKDISKYYFNNIENLYNSDKFFSDDENMETLCYIYDRAAKLIELIKDSARAELKKAA